MIIWHWTNIGMRQGELHGDVGYIKADERHPSEDGHWDIQHIRLLLIERDAYKATLEAISTHTAANGEKLLAASIASIALSDFASDASGVETK